MARKVKVRPKKRLHRRTRRITAEYFLRLPVKKAEQGTQRILIVDSGASYHSIKRSDIAPWERKPIRKVAEPKALQIANWIVQERKVVNAQVDGVNAEIECYSLNNAHNVVSMGRLCNDHGYDYVQHPINLHIYKRFGTKDILSTNPECFMHRNQSVRRWSRIREGSGNQRIEGPGATKWRRSKIGFANWSVVDSFAWGKNTCWSLLDWRCREISARAVRFAEH